MDVVQLGQAALALLFVLGLIAGLAWIVRKLGIEKRLHGNDRGIDRLGVAASWYLDPRRRLVLIKRDDVEHLLLLSQSGDIVIEPNIKPAKAHDTSKA